MESAINWNRTPSHFLSMSLPFTFAPYGLEGTRGAKYGPIAVWLDQIFLSFTHNPILMVAMRAALVSAITAISLYWLCRTLGVSPWLAVAVMLSPWLYFYSRQLWDNSLGIPVSALFLAAYTDFVKSHRAWSLHAAIICAPVLLLIHFMTIPLVAAVTVHAALIEFRSLRRFKWSIAGILVLTLGISWPYWSNLFHSYHHEVPGGTSSHLGWFYPFLGAHHLSAAGLSNIYGEHWRAPAPTILLIAQYVTELAYIAGWLGMLVAILSVWRVATRSNLAKPSDHVYTIAWAAVIFQCLLYGPLHVYEGPHYFNASWICFALFAFLAAKSAPRVLSPVLCIYCAAQLGIGIFLFISVYRNAGMRSDNYGTALSNQIAAVRELQQYTDDSPRRIEIPEWSEHSRTPAVLEMLMAPPPGPRPHGDLLIHYRNAWPNDARIIVTNLLLRQSPPPPP